MTARFMHWLRLTLAAAAVLVLALQIVMVQVAAKAVQTSSETLAGITGHRSANAQTLIAALSLNRGDTDGAIGSAAAALRLAPAQTSAIPILAAAQAMKRRPLLAARLMDLSARAGWRDPATQWWVLQLAIAASNFNVAAQRADALLRQRQLELPAIGALRRIERSGSRQALAERFAENPPWKSLYLTNVAGLAPAQLSARAALLTEVQKRGVTLTEAEIAAPVNALTMASRAAEARGWWISLTNPEARKFGVSDGSFDRLGKREGRPPPVPFEWKLSNPIDAGAEVVARPDGSGGVAVHVAANAGAAGDLLHQVMTLNRGPYLLTFSFAVDDGEFPARWSIVCADGRTLGQKQVRRAGGDWARAAYAFNVPAGCESQHLRLGLTGRNINRIEFWLDDVSVEPAGGR